MGLFLESDCLVVCREPILNSSNITQKNYPSLLLGKIPWLSLSANREPLRSTGPDQSSFFSRKIKPFHLPPHLVQLFPLFISFHMPVIWLIGGGPQWCARDPFERGEPIEFRCDFRLRLDFGGCG